ncbi:MAG: SusE domain-containing protein [Saprospiraceae bacterium]
MKNSILYLFSLLLLTGLFSCEDNDADPRFSLEAKEVLTSPTAGTSFVLLKPEANNPINFTWTAAKFQPTNLASTTYKLQMALSGTAFASPVNLGSTKELSLETTVGKLNNFLLGLGQTPEVSVDIDLRLVANIDDLIEDVISDVVTISVTPYNTVVIVKPIYLLGDGTLAGWDNMAALPMTPLDSGRFEIVTMLSADKQLKFISSLGAWAPQWGTDATGTTTAGPLVYRETEAVPDPPAIPTPAVASQYKIIADTVKLTYQVFEYGDIWLLGGSTPAGWDNTKALPMAKVDDGKYTIDVMLDPAVGNQWKIIDERGAWAPQWGTDATGTWEAGPLLFRETEAVPDPAAIPEPPDAGMYRIEVDIENLSYTVTKL